MNEVVRPNMIVNSLVKIYSLQNRVSDLIKLLIYTVTEKECNRDFRGIKIKKSFDRKTRKESKDLIIQGSQADEAVMQPTENNASQSIDEQSEQRSLPQKLGECSLSLRKVMSNLHLFYINFVI